MKNTTTYNLLTYYIIIIKSSLLISYFYISAVFTNVAFIHWINSIASVNVKKRRYSNIFLVIVDSLVLIILTLQWAEYGYLITIFMFIHLFDAYFS